MIFVLILSVIMIVPAVLSLVAVRRIWKRHPRTRRVIKWAMAIRIFLSLFPPGFIGPLGVGPFAVPLDLAVLVYAFVPPVKRYFASPPAGVAAV